MAYLTDFNIKLYSSSCKYLYEEILRKSNEDIDYSIFYEQFNKLNI